MKKIIIVLALLCLAIQPATALVITWAWDPPTEGSPPVHYEFEQNINDSGWVLVAQPLVTELEYDMPMGSVMVRVRAVDQFGRPGPWAEAAEPYVDAGPPGGCTGLRIK